MYNQASYLVHHGIKGQKWGVRRFQNEDGTLTEEGKKRYLRNYDMMDKQADEEILGASRQVADIEKNGWKAKSVFTSGFIKQLKKRGVLDDPELSKSYLDQFKKVFEQNIKDAKLKKEVAREARNFIENNVNITYDDILRESVKTDNKHKTNLEEFVRALGDDLGLKEKTQKIDVWYDEKTIKNIKNKYSKEELEDLVDQAKSAFKQQLGKDTLSDMKVNGTPFKDMPLEDQALIVMQIFQIKDED